jgi:hypothetical protein
MVSVTTLQGTTMYCTCDAVRSHLNSKTQVICQGTSLPVGHRVEGHQQQDGQHAGQDALSHHGGQHTLHTTTACNNTLLQDNRMKQFPGVKGRISFSSMIE